MERELGKEFKDKEQRVKFLRDNSDGVEKKGYMKMYTHEQLLQMKEMLSEVAIDINDIDEERKTIMSEFKERLKPLNEEKKHLLTGLKNKAQHVNEDCFKFIDTESRVVGFYNQDGDLVESRPAYAEELQTNIFQINRTGTNN